MQDDRSQSYFSSSLEQRTMMCMRLAIQALSANLWYRNQPSHHISDLFLFQKIYTALNKPYNSFLKQIFLSNLADNKFVKLHKGLIYMEIP